MVAQSDVYVEFTDQLQIEGSPHTIACKKYLSIECGRKNR